MNFENEISNSEETFEVWWLMIWSGNNLMK